MPKLSKKVVDATTPDPAGKDRFLWDDTLKGFGLKITAKGAKSYVLSYWNAEGCKKRFTIGQHGAPWTCEQARTKAETLLADLRLNGTDPMAVKIAARKAMTIADLADLYLGPEGSPADQKEFVMETG